MFRLNKLVFLSLGVIGAVLTTHAKETMNTTPTFRIEQRSTKPMLVSDRPYEDFQIGCVNVIREGKVWHMWYSAYDHNYKTDADGYLCYARSADGLKWEKPNLGLVEYGGNKDNNILIAGPPIGGVHGHTVFLDPSAPAAERFKLVFTKNVNGGWLVAGGTSPDGIHWKLIDKLLLARNSDTQTVCFRDGEVYRMYVRMWSKGVFSGQRLVGYTESKTFGDFPDPVMVLAPDDKDAPDFHFYNSAATKLKDSLYVMFPSAYHGKTGIVIPHMAVSTDGRKWERMGREPKIPLGQGFDSKSIYVGPGAVPGDKLGTWWIYYAGYTAGHDDQYKTKVQHMGGIGRFLLVEEGPNQ
jgi:hypothetical protein